MRQQYIDILKGFTIIWVLWMHMDMPELINPAVQMPIFFFISGTFYKAKDTAFSSQLKKDSFKLLLPALCFTLLSYVIVGAKNGFSWNVFHDLNNAVIASIVWFLLALFIFRTIAYPLAKAHKSVYILLIASAIYIPGFYLYSKELYWIIPCIPIAHAGCFMLYFAIGLLWGGRILSCMDKFNVREVVTMVLMVGYILLVHALDWKYSYLKYIPYCIYGLPYTLCVIYLMSKFAFFSQRFEKFTKPLVYIGQNSIVFYLTHWPLWMHVFKPLGWNPYLCFVIIVMLEFPLIYIFNNYIPWMIGKKK